jgi:hypothetical protein
MNTLKALTIFISLFLAADILAQTPSHLGVGLGQTKGGLLPKAAILWPVNNKVAVGMYGTYTHGYQPNLSKERILQGGLRLEYTFKPNARISPILPFEIGKNLNKNTAPKKNSDNTNNINVPPAVMYLGVGLQGKTTFGAWQLSTGMRFDSALKQTPALMTEVQIRIGLNKKTSAKPDTLK